MIFLKSHAVALQTEADMNPTTIRGGILLFLYDQITPGYGLILLDKILCEFSFKKFERC